MMQHIYLRIIPPKRQGSWSSCTPTYGPHLTSPGIHWHFLNWCLQLQSNFQKKNWSNLFLSCAGLSLLHLLSLVVLSGGYSSCSLPASHCRSFSWCGARARGLKGSVLAVLRLWNTGSIVVMRGLSCLVTCGIFPDQDWNRMARRILYHWATGKSPKVILISLTVQFLETESRV